MRRLALVLALFGFAILGYAQDSAGTDSATWVEVYPDHFEVNGTNLKCRKTLKLYATEEGVTSASPRESSDTRATLASDWAGAWYRSRGRSGCCRNRAGCNRSFEGLG